METSSFVVYFALIITLTVTLTLFQGSSGFVIKGDPLSQSVIPTTDGENDLTRVKGMNEDGEGDPVIKGISASLTRVKRSMKEDIEESFKEFSDKVAKLPDQLTGSIKKYFEEKGVSVESIQKILGDIWSGVEKLIQEIKKAL